MHFHFQMPKVIDLKKNRGHRVNFLVMSDISEKSGLEILLECCHGNCWRQNNSWFRSSVNYLIQTYKNITVALVCLFVLFLQSYEPSKTWKLVRATLTHLHNFFFYRSSHRLHVSNSSFGWLTRLPVFFVICVWFLWFLTLNWKPLLTLFMQLDLKLLFIGWNENLFLLVKALCYYF